MDIQDKIEFRIGYGMHYVSVDDMRNKKRYNEEYFESRIGFLFRYFQKRAEKRAIKRAMKFISKKVFNNHQKMMKEIEL